MSGLALAGQLVEPVLNLVDDLFTSDEERAAAKLRILEAQQKGELAKIEQQLSAIMAEANSKDPWTSRARPAFLYVIYILVLAAIPFGALSALAPDVANSVSDGVQDWLAAIPEPLWMLFGAGYLGYSGMRTWDKHTEMKGKKP